MAVPIAPIVGAAMSLVSQILEWVDEGMSTEDIQKRLADPSGVGAEMLNRIQERRNIGRRLLGRDPE